MIIINPKEISVFITNTEIIGPTGVLNRRLDMSQKAADAPESSDASDTPTSPKAPDSPDAHKKTKIAVGGEPSKPIRPTKFTNPISFIKTLHFNRN